MRRFLLAVLCLALSTICITSRLVAAPHYGTPWKLKQPDGALVDVRIWGDEYYQVVETPDGYTLMRDPRNDWIVYADLSADGNELVPTNVRYGTGSPVLAGVSPHVRINPDVARAQAEQTRLEAFGGQVPENMRIGGGPVMAPPSTGNVVGLVLLADFSDINGTISKTEVENFCNQVGYNNNGNNGSVHDYFNDVSNGNLNYTFYVNDYHEGTGGSFAAYYDDCAQPWLSRAVELIKEILDEMDANGFDFSGYDANADGEIDAINLFFAGNGTVCGWAKGMWPGAAGMGGNGWTYDGKLANRFQITNMGAAITLGTFCHENGHMVCGWPDLYDYDGDSAGTGGYDIMSNGMSATNPIEPSAELKRSAGWTTPTLLPGAPTTGLSLATSSGNAAYRFNKNGNEWYLLENRQKTGRDAALPTSGLALWHIDTTGNNSLQQMTNAQHYYVTLVQADGDWDLENNVNQGDSGDLYKSTGNDAATPCTDPNTDWWDGSVSNLSITNISASQATMTFDFSNEDNDPVAQVQNYGADADQNCCIEVAVSDIDNGSYDPDGPGDIASLCITAVDGNSVGCQQSVTICGDGDHTVRLTITDLCGNTDFADATVEVENEPPVIAVQDHEDIADDQCCIIVTVADIDAGSYDPDGAGDIKSLCITDVDGSPVSCEVSVSVCGEGFHTVDLTITDWCDSTRTATANVEVIDATPPDIDVVMDRDALWPPNHKLVEVCAEITVTDNCDPDPDVALVSVTSDEPDNDKGDGNTVDDIQGTDYGTEDTCFDLRSERMGGGDGRVYEIVYSATDNAGNVGYDTVCVEVPHDQSASAVCSSGFLADGSALSDNADRFALIIPGSALFDIRNIDETNIYVGNTAGVLRSFETRRVEATNDEIVDLAVFFERPAAALEPLDGVMSGTISIDDESIDAGTISDGPVGLHFVTKDGTNYLVSNIYALGTPVALPAAAGRKTITPDGDTLSRPDAPAAGDRVTALGSIHPNPFNPQTTVDFSLASAAKVQIAIYDVKGSLVRRLVDQTMPAGTHSTRWNGVDDAGRPASSGIYFVRMIAGSHTEVRKIVMLK
jgi:M6 family metalloprotease-like protein